MIFSCNLFHCLWTFNIFFCFKFLFRLIGCISYHIRTIKSSRLRKEWEKAKSISTIKLPVKKRATKLNVFFSLFILFDFELVFFHSFEMSSWLLLCYWYICFNIMYAVCTWCTCYIARIQFYYICAFLCGWFFFISFNFLENMLAQQVYSLSTIWLTNGTKLSVNSIFL